MHLKTWLAGAVFGAVIAAGVGIAYAAIPDSTGVIHACWQNVTGPNKPVKLLNTSQKATCPSGWIAVTWNQKGQAGAAGVSGYTTVSASFTPTTQGSTAISAEADCPSGKVPLGGGFTVDNFPAFTTRQDAPVYVRDGTNKVIGGGWTATVGGNDNNSLFGPNQTIHVYVNCATAN